MRFETNHIPNIASTHEKNQVHGTSRADSRSKSTVIASLSLAQRQLRTHNLSVLLLFIALDVDVRTSNLLRLMQRSLPERTVSQQRTRLVSCSDAASV